MVGADAGSEIPTGTKRGEDVFAENPFANLPDLSFMLSSTLQLPKE